MHYRAISTTVWFPLDDRSAVWPATEAISVMMEYCCSEAMIIVVSFWFLCASDEANMQMRGPPYGSIRHCLSATGETMNSGLCSQCEFYLAGCFRNNVWLCVSKWDSHRYNVARQCACVRQEAPGETGEHTSPKYCRTGPTIVIR